MSYSAENIIQVDAAISPAGLGFSNFASAMLIAPADELGSRVADTYKTYANIQEVAADYGEATETYKAASMWLGGTPKIRSVMIWASDESDASITATLNKARNKVWWYWTLLDATALADEAVVIAAANWCEQNASMFVNSQTGDSADAIRNQNTTTDIATALTTMGLRHVYTAAHETNAYSGSALAKHFAAVNYSGTNTTITGEFKKSPGVAAEDVDGSSTAAMFAKKVAFYPIVELQGSQDVGRWINTTTHSTYGEYIDDVVNLDAFINTLTVRLYNALAGVTTKLQQTPRGQAVLLAVARQVGEQYIANGYLGPRNYVDPDTGLDAYTEGFEIPTKPEDILDISTEDRASRLAAPIKIRLFRAGAIHKAIVDLSVY